MGRASMSARRANQGWSRECDPTEATRPVLARGHVYSIPSESSSDRMSWLVSNSSKANSGFWWILLRTLLNQSENSASLADSNNSRVNSVSSDPDTDTETHLNCSPWHVNIDNNNNKRSRHSMRNKHPKQSSRNSEMLLWIFWCGNWIWFYYVIVNGT